MPRLAEHVMHQAIGMMAGGIAKREITRRLGRHVPTICRLQTRNQQSGSARDRPRRQRITTLRQDIRMRVLHLRNRFLTASETARHTIGLHGVIGYFAGLPSLKRFGSSRCDDCMDRLSHVYTSLLLLTFAFLISTTHLVGTPIKCWIPAELKPGNSFENYIHNYCWMRNTYYIPMLDVIPSDVSRRQDEEITYYQWVPLILLLQAFLFKLPFILWKMLHVASGLNLSSLCKTAELTQCKSKEDRKGVIESLVFVMEKWIQYRKSYSNNSAVARAKARFSHLCCFFCSKREGTYLTSLYLFIRYTVQCVLPINLFNEKIFLFLWFWFCFIAILCGCNFIKWIYLVVFKRNNYEYVKKYIYMYFKLDGRRLEATDKQLCRKFADKYLRDDGCFVARMVGMNSTDMVIMDMFGDMFADFKERQRPGSIEENGDSVEAAEQ